MNKYTTLLSILLSSTLQLFAHPNAENEGIQQSGAAELAVHPIAHGVGWIAVGATGFYNEALSATQAGAYGLFGILNLLDSDAVLISASWLAGAIMERVPCGGSWVLPHRTVKFAGFGLYGLAKIVRQIF